MPDTALSAPTKFAVGQPVRRTEDPRLLRGAGRYTDDVSLPGEAHAWIVRSPYPHGEIRDLDTAAAKAAPGVVAVFTGEDLQAAGYGSLPCTLPLKSHDGTPLIVPPRPSLAVGRVRHVGEAVAAVVAETAAQARDAADLVTFDVDPLPVNVDCTKAVISDPIWPDHAPDNTALHWRGGDRAAVEEAFARAAHVTRLRLIDNRCAVATLEPRAAVADFDSENGRYILHVCSQGVFGMRGMLADHVLQVEPEKVHVLTGDVGGSFGMKSAAYPEYVAILHAAKTLGRPVKWCDERGMSFISDHGGRDAVMEAALALDAEGAFLAVKAEGHGNLGAYLSPHGPLCQTMNILKNIQSVYRTPAVWVDIRAVFTNTTPIAAYRGAGRPEGNYYMESLIDQAARETGHDRLDLRRRNMIPAEAMPYKAANGQTYDSGDFPAVLEDAVRRTALDGFAKREADSRARGLLRGLGVSTYCEVTATPGKEMGGIRFEADGTVTIVTGTKDYGQGHAATFAQILCDRLGVPFEAVRLHQGDSDELIAGGGTGGSRSVMASGRAILAAADLVVENGRAIAGALLEAAQEDIEFEAGVFRVVGTDRAVDIMTLAERARAMDPRPEGAPASLNAETVENLTDPAYPNGSHVCEVEIDPDTGVVRVDLYAMVDDFGALINPLLVEGQVHGGVTQGIGQALMEHAVYDPDGQLLSGSFMDYCLPRASDLPRFDFHSHPVPAKTTALGVKGCGEAGVSGSLPAVMNAVNDAVTRAGGVRVDMPATAERVWRALQALR